MPHQSSACTTTRHRDWGRDLTEVAALFAAMAAADLVADLVGNGPDGSVLLVTSSVGLIAAAAFHTWWTHRHRRTDPAAAEAAQPAPARPAEQREEGREEVMETALWRLRTTVRDAPGSLGAVCTALASSRVDIVTLETHPLAEGTVDEFLLRAPAALTAAALVLTVADAGGTDTWLARADAHDLADAPTRMLTLATRTALDAAEVPLALRQLFGRCAITSVPPEQAGRDGGPAAGAEDTLEPTVMRLRDPSGGTLTVSRPYLPFTPTEFARARALLELDARLGVRTSAGRDTQVRPESGAITIRQAGPGDHKAALAMHDRCSPATLAARYHGPVHEADRYLAHLLSPRFGRSLAVETASGRLVALGHLLWDGDENEVALLVEDEWQRRGIGSALLRQLVELAAEAARESVYAVTQSTNTGMVATMRELDLPLDYQVEDGTLLITAALPSGAGSPAGRLPWATGRRH
jgi:GNAT superfamily N-acetyltransferase